jgi:hypothetical protein
LFEVGDYFLGVATEGGFGVEVFFAGGGDEVEELFAEGFFVEGFGEGGNLPGVDDVAGGEVLLLDLFADGLGKHEGGEARGEVFEDGGLSRVVLFFGGLDLLPLGEDAGGVADVAGVVSKDVGVAADEFFVHFAGDVVEGEVVVFLGDLGVEEDLDEDVAEFLAHVGEVVLVDGFEEFADFVDEAAGEGLVGLLDVPGAAVGGAEAGDGFAEVGDGGHGGINN